MRIVPISVAESLPAHTPERWTAIIPAAGRGSRLGYDKPKILFPVAGRPILDHLINLLEPLVDRFVFILSPSGAPIVSPLIQERLGSRSVVAIQKEPRGMADAIAQGLPLSQTEQTLILWGDQPAVRPQTVQVLQQLHEQTPGARLTLPLVHRAEPYVHFTQDQRGKLSHILKRREGDAMPEYGDADCGVFAFNTAELTSLFANAVLNGKTLTNGTNEWDMHPMLPQLDVSETSINAFYVESTEETIGINSLADAELLERHYAATLK